MAKEMTENIMEAFDMIVNSLPVKTWNHLHMNETSVPQVAVHGKGAVTVSGGLSLTLAENPRQFETIPTGNGKDVDVLLSRAGVKADALVITPGGEPEPTRLTFSYQDGDAAANQLLVTLGEGSTATVLMDYTSPLSAAGLGVVQIKIYAEKNATLRLVQVQRVGSGFTFFNDIGAFCQEGARVELTQLVLSGEKSYTGCEVKLEGNQSSMNADVAYALAQREKLDMNYVVRHIGKQTNSSINAAGSLRDRSAKLFRGTIDFLNGSAGSVGNEKEEVLLIDEETVNQTIPLILCAEEDVEGNHGASIGKPDEEVLFYLASRGIPEAEAYDLLTRAKLDAVAGKICDSAFRQEVLDYIKGGADDV